MTASEDFTFEGVNVGVRSITLLLHLYGIHLLWRDKWKKHFLLINVALTNVAMCCCSFAKLALTLLRNEIALRYLLGIVATGFLVTYFGSLFLLTVQRFLEVRLHMSYSNSFFEMHKQRICALIWISSLLYAVIMTVALHHGVSEHVIYDTIPHVYEMVWQFVLVLQFFIVYGYLYGKFRQSGKTPSLKRRTIFVPFIVVFSFIIFDTVPGILLYFLSTEYNIKNVITLLYSLDMLCNSLLYIFIRKDVRGQIARRAIESPVHV